MQARFREHWADLAVDETEPRELDDFGWHYPEEYVLETCSLAVLSGFRLLPRAGGIDDQDWWWVQDFRRYLSGYGRALWEAQPVTASDIKPEANQQALIAHWKPFG